MRNGRSHAGRDLVLYVFPRGGDDPPRLGLSVSRKVGGAVERNRVKRLLREAFAQEAERLPSGADAVVIARPGARQLAENGGLRGIHEALRALVDKVEGVAAAVPGDLDGAAQEPGPEAGAPGSEPGAGRSAGREDEAVAETPGGGEWGGERGAAPGAETPGPKSSADETPTTRDPAPAGSDHAPAGSDRAPVGSDHE